VFVLTVELCRPCLRDYFRPWQHFASLIRNEFCCWGGCVQNYYYYFLSLFG